MILHNRCGIVFDSKTWGKSMDGNTFDNTFDNTIYMPNDDEEFMSDRQLNYFKNKLLEWKESIMEGNRNTIEDMQVSTRSIPDAADRASEETDRALELRTRDRQRKLISKIDSALRRIDEGTYGFCEDSGEPISLKRLMARPIATLSLAAQESHERKERVHKET